MKSQRLGLLQLGLLAATLVIVAVFFQTRSGNIELHEQRVGNIQELKQLDSRLDRDVLRVTSFLLDYYDPLVETVVRIRDLLNVMGTDEQGLFGPMYSVIEMPLLAYRGAMSEKLRLLEHLKSRAALVRNGLQYLPVVVQDYISQEQGEGEVQLSNLLNQLLRYNLMPSASEAEQISLELRELRLMSEFLDSEGVLENAVFHMQANLDRMGELTALRSRYVGIPSAEMLDSVHRVYLGYQAEQARAGEIFSGVLLAVTMLLFLGLGFALRKLGAAHLAAKQAWNKLHDAVESISEAFALFDADGKLVLNNSRYQEFYPWQADLLKLGTPLSQLAERTSKHIKFARSGTEQEALPIRRMPCLERETYVQHLSDGRWLLARDNCTSDGGMVSVRIDITDSKRAEENLRKLTRAVEQSPVSVVITDVEGRIEYVNPKFEQATGYAKEEAIGQNPRILRSGDKGASDYKQLWETITAGKIWRGEFHNKRKDGTLFWEAASISPIRNEQGEVTHFIAVKEDITARKFVDEQLRLAATVFQTTTEGILVADAKNRIKTVNPAFTRITGFELSEVQGKDPQILSSGQHDAAFYKAMWQRIRKHGCWEGEIWNRRKNGEVYPQSISIAAITDEGNAVKEYVAVFRDITRRKKDEEQIRRQANFDALTGLPNRTTLIDRLTRAIASARREDWKVALLFIDLDRFKGVNDTLGHLVGDKLLQQVAARLQERVRETDTVARFGGDEFVVVLEDVNSEADAAEKARCLIGMLCEVFTIDGREIFVGASIGITLYPADSDDPATMLRNADMAMYRAKEAGRNTYQFFTPGMNHQVQVRMELERDLRRALERGELQLLYQPIVNVDSGRTESVEALIRWEHPQRGEISPATFIPLAEETGVIDQIGLWVMRTACEQARTWLDAGLVGLKVSINISSRQWKLGLNSSVIASVLADAGIPAEFLTLEMTEGLMMDSGRETIAWFQSIRDLGISLTVDDFGTGYSSLSYLKRFPMNSLKIDRSFINDLLENPEDASMVETILAMARSLDLDVVAEGVETQGQLDFLRRLGCDYAQGYYFSPPVAPKVVPTLMQWDPRHEPQILQRG